MFIDTNYRRRLSGAKLHLAKPNKNIVSHIFEAREKKLSIKVGDINELSFTIPYEVEEIDGYELIKNKHVEMIKNKMLIRVTMEGYSEWFVVQDIEETGSEIDTFSVSAYSLGYETKGKRISGLESSSINVAELLDIILKDTLWKIGFIDPVFSNMYRSFSSGDNSNALNCIVEMAKVFNCIIDWDTENRRMSLLNPESHGKFEGMTVDYGRLLQSIKKTRQLEEFTTRLYVRGNNGLTISKINPSGEEYLEDFSYYMYPFERDENRNILKSSYFMSDDLCHALLDHDFLLDHHSSTIKNLRLQLFNKNESLVTEESSLRDLELELENIHALLTIALSTNDVESVSSLKIQLSNKNSEISIKNNIVNSIRSDISDINNNLESIYLTISNQANFTPSLKDELKLFIHENTWQDDNYIDEEDLYNDALKKFEDIRTPKMVIETSISNVLNAIEEQYYWDKLVLGDFVRVSYPIMNLQYQAKIIEMNFDIDNNEVNLIIANTDDSMNSKEKLIELLYSNKTATTLIQSNKYKFDKINDLESEVYQLITQEWDATKRRISAGVRNSVKIGSRGIIITDPTFPNEIIILNSGVIALSRDDGETWKTAISARGIVAERLIGQIIAGQELLITNSSGSFTMNEDGFHVDTNSFKVTSASNRDKNLVDSWNNTDKFIRDLTDDNILTSYEKELLRAEWIKLKVNKEYVDELISLYFENNEQQGKITQFNNAYDSLDNYLNTYLQADGFSILNKNNMNNNSTIDRHIFESHFSTYNEELLSIENLISFRIKELSSISQSLAQDAINSIAEISSNIVYKVELTSTNGIIFKNNNIETVIYARVFKGNEDITHTIPNSSFIWKKFDKDGLLDIDWANSHEGVGNTIEVNRNDVFQKATFSCDINIED